jgi:hypothetical protein
MSRLPADSPRFKEGLESQWRELDVCAQERIDRTNPDYSPYMALETREGPTKRACWNSWIAPHNFEGFLLNMGDMLVKSGDWQTGQKIYATAKLSRDYAAWKFAAVLEARIAQAQDNVAAFNGAQDAPVRPIMINSAFACTGCHQQQSTAVFALPSSSRLHSRSFAKNREREAFEVEGSSTSATRPSRSRSGLRLRLSQACGRPAISRSIASSRICRRPTRRSSTASERTCPRFRANAPMTTRPIAKAPMAAAPNARAPIATAPTDAARIDWAAARTAGFISTDVSDCWPRGSFLSGRSMILILLDAAGSCKLRRGDRVSSAAVHSRVCSACVIASPL